MRRLGLAGGSVGRRRGSLKDSILPVILTSLGGGIGAVLLGTPWRPPTAPIGRQVFAPRGRILALPSLVETELLADGGTGWSKNLVPPPPESLVLLVSVRYVALEPVTSCGQYCVDYDVGGPFDFEKGEPELAEKCPRKNPWKPNVRRVAAWLCCGRPGPGR